MLDLPALPSISWGSSPVRSNPQRRAADFTPTPRIDEPGAVAPLAEPPRSTLRGDGAFPDDRKPGLPFGLDISKGQCIALGSLDGDLIRLTPPTGR